MNRSKYIYIYNGSFINLLNLIKKLISKKIIPLNIKDEYYQANLFEDTFKEEISDDEKVIEEIVNYFSRNILGTIYYIFLSNDKDKEIIIYYFILYSLKYKNKVYYMRNLEIVNRALKIEKYVRNENHKFKGFVRFKELDNNVLWAEIAPENNIIFLLGKHFQRRLKNEYFAIKDVKRNILCVYDKINCYLLEDNINFNVKFSSSEKDIQNMWKDFYKTIGIKERKNDRCRRNFMPKKYWKYIIEVSELDEKSS